MFFKSLQYVPNYGEDAPEGYDPGDVYAAELEEKDPLKAEEFRKLRGFFSEFALGPNGLTDDPVVAEAIDTAMEKLYTGEVVLPTPEEYLSLHFLAFLPFLIQNPIQQLESFVYDYPVFAAPVPD